ncbi:MAG: hypothetical protein Q9224_005206, partial [Gallowayella concinna]
MSPQRSDIHPTRRTERIIVNHNSTSPPSPVRSIEGFHNKQTALSKVSDNLARMYGPTGVSPRDTLFPPFRPDFCSPRSKPTLPKSSPTRPKAPSIPANSPPPSNPGISDAARIRDNQRRSRARRAEYVRELEDKVRAYEKEGVQATTEVQASARRVVEENGLLRQEVRRLQKEVIRLEEKNIRDIQVVDEDERLRRRLGLTVGEVGGKRKRLLDDNDTNNDTRQKSKTI